MRSSSYAAITFTNFRWILLPCLLFFLEAENGRGQSQLLGDDDSTYIQEFMGQHCLSCHSGDSPEGNVALPRFSTANSLENIALWEEVLTRVIDKSMPPEDFTSLPTTDARSLFEEKLAAAVNQTRLEIEEMQPFVPRRLNRREYAATIRSLMKIDWDCSDRFPLDDSLYGFDTVAEGLQLSTVLAECWMETASEAIDRALRFDEPPKLRSWNFCWENEFDQHPGFQALGIYNGNAHLGFGNKTIYIGGPAMFVEVTNHPLSRLAAEGIYKVVARMTPRNFPANAVASLQFDSLQRTEARQDFPITNGQEIHFECSFYVDRSDPAIKAELNWTNGHHLTWPVRNSGLRDPYFNYWWLINHKRIDGKQVDWSPKTPEEVPFGFFENITFELTGPHFESWPPPSTQTLLGSNSEQIEPTKVLQNFVPRAFRRPVSEEELRFYTEVYRSNLQKLSDPQQALKGTLATILLSPEFLFISRSSTDDQHDMPCTDYELASRLSYFLWSSMPDDELRAAADKGTLREPEVLRAQVKRMLQHPKSSMFKKQFPTQWLRLNRLSTVMPEPKLFPFYNESLRDAMRSETLDVFSEFVDRNLSIVQLLDSDWSYINERLADFYGIPGVHGDSMRRFSPMPENRRSLVTHASLLLLTSEATRTSPVLRGKWILESLFHRPPPPPPPNVSGLQPDASKARTVTEHLQIHRQIPSCVDCHSKIDPFGISLENYDAIGEWRDAELPWRDPASETSTKEDLNNDQPIPIRPFGKLADGSLLDGHLSLREYLKSRRKDVAIGVSEQLMIYALGRGLRSGDRREVQAIVNSLESTQWPLQDLILAVVESHAFQSVPPSPLSQSTGSQSSGLPRRD